MAGLIRLALFMLFLLAIFAVTMWIYFNAAMTPKKSPAPKDTSALVWSQKRPATGAQYIKAQSARHAA
jgi:hypothetical protein